MMPFRPIATAPPYDAEKSHVEQRVLLGLGWTMPPDRRSGGHADVRLMRRSYGGAGWTALNQNAGWTVAFYPTHWTVCPYVIEPELVEA